MLLLLLLDWTAVSERFKRETLSVKEMFESQDVIFGPSQVVDRSVFLFLFYVLAGGDIKIIPHSDTT